MVVPAWICPVEEHGNLLFQRRAVLVDDAAFWKRRDMHGVTEVEQRPRNSCLREIIQNLQAPHREWKGPVAHDFAFSVALFAIERVVQTGMKVRGERGCGAPPGISRGGWRPLVRGSAPYPCA